MKANDLTMEEENSRYRDGTLGMPAKEFNDRMVAMFGGNTKRSIGINTNRAIRHLPGGTELLNALTRISGLRHTARTLDNRPQEAAYDIAMDVLEDIRYAMGTYIHDQVRSGKKEIPTVSAKD